MSDAKWVDEAVERAAGIYFGYQPELTERIRTELGEAFRLGQIAALERQQRELARLASAPSPTPPPAGDATLLGETLAWVRAHPWADAEHFSKHSPEASAFLLLRRWLAQPAPPAASSSSREVAERIVPCSCGKTARNIPHHGSCLVSIVAAALDAERRARESLIDHIARESHEAGIGETMTPEQRVTALARIRTARTAPPAGDERGGEGGGG